MVFPGFATFNLFFICSTLYGIKKELDRDVRYGLTALYNCWKNRSATLKFVQDIPVKKDDQAMALWKMWRKRFPNAQINTISHAGHYVLEDAPGKTAMLVKDFLTQNPKFKTGLNFGFSSGAIQSAPKVINGHNK